MHTQCREKTKDINHTFQMVGGQSSVHVKLATSEVNMEKWVSLYPVHQMLSCHQTSANKDIHTYMKYHCKLTLVYGMKCCMRIWTQQYGKIGWWRRRALIAANHGPPDNSNHGEKQTLRKWSELLQGIEGYLDEGSAFYSPFSSLYENVVWWSTWESGVQELMSSRTMVIGAPTLMEVITSYNCSSFIPTNFCLLICLQMTLLLNRPMLLCLIWNLQSQWVPNLVYSFWKGANLASINYLGNMTAWHARGTAGRNVL